MGGAVSGRHREPQGTHNLFTSLSFGKDSIFGCQQVLCEKTKGKVVEENFCNQVDLGYPGSYLDFLTVKCLQAFSVINVSRSFLRKTFHCICPQNSIPRSPG